jgi:ribosomal subunit interface protein
MKTDWTARGTNVPEPIRQRVEQQLGRLERFLRDGAEASAVLSQEGDDQGTARRTLELVVRSRIGTFTAEESSHDLTDCANAVLSRIESQVRRTHDKLVNGKRRGEAEPWPGEVVGAD